MASTKFYLDDRKLKKDGTASLKLLIGQDTKTSTINMGLSLLPEQWDSTLSRVVGRKDKAILNVSLVKYKQSVDEILIQLAQKGELRRYSALELREKILEILSSEGERRRREERSFIYNFQKFTDRHSGRTKEIYEATLVHLRKYLGQDAGDLTFEEIGRAWLEDFEDYLSKTSPSKNARNIHLRNIRAVFNYAIDREITNNYPFRRFSIKPVETPKRSLSVDELRKLFNYPCEPWQRQYIDIFKLMFMLCGINIVDLYRLDKIVNDRIEYRRAKTKKSYSIKVEPEILHLINLYKGETHLLNLADRCSDYRHYAMRLNKSLQTLQGFEEITTYWARHSWATIAAELDIPKETIAAALGHEIGNRVTSIYIRFNQNKVDEANRKVIDYVLYDKK